MKLNLQDAIDGKLDEQLNLALCEWLGWSHCDPAKVGGPNVYHLKGSGFDTSLPNHISAAESLTLLREIELKLNDDQRWVYAMNLSYVVKVSNGGRHATDFEMITASPRLRTIALLITLTEVFQP